MKIAVTGHQIDIGDALKSHVTDRLEHGISKYFDGALEAHVRFSREGTFYAEGQADDADIYASFNAAAEHVEKQLRRSKRKLRGHH